MADTIGKLIGFLILLRIAYWVFQDARSRDMNATGWSIGVFLLLIIFLPAYFIVRKPKIDDMEEFEEAEEIPGEQENAGPENT